jgi:DegV family protein with EDD domain
MGDRYYLDNDVERIYFSYFFNGEIMPDTGVEQDIDSFYALISSGERTTTFVVNLQTYLSKFHELLSTGRPVVYLAFSSGLSDSCKEALAAREMIKKDFPDGELYIIDSVAASMGEGLLLDKAVKMRDEGKSAKEIADWLETNKLNCQHWFTVNDLSYLQRGGRISNVSAYIGSMLDIRPLMTVNYKGNLVPVTKVRGEKRILKAMAAKVGELALDIENNSVFIGHGDCLADALTLKALIEKEYRPQEIVISRIGSVIGTHTGSGVLALFFMSSKAKKADKFCSYWEEED